MTDPAFLVEVASRDFGAEDRIQIVISANNTRYSFKLSPGNAQLLGKRLVRESITMLNQRKHDKKTNSNGDNRQ